MNYHDPIEPKQITQGFGVNPQDYKRFGLNGHNGWDYKTKWADTPDGIRNILAPFDCVFYVIGNEGNDGYGKYIEVIIHANRTWKLTLAHCSQTTPFSSKKSGEVVSIAGNTGNSTAPHTHLTTKPGKIINNTFVSDSPNNGFKGAVDPQEFFNDLASLQGGSMDIDWKQSFLTLGVSFGDQFNENWNPDEKKAYVKKIQDKAVHYKDVADHPPAPVGNAPTTAADSLILAGNLMKQGK